ncbi:MAG: hypothetical protein DRR16_19740 [Candidatus Parabeggiatoa sp. nov. 3]|nr:MAG: hypothetical protein DRR00_19575 [Gammaproteobacteria bacterium]RKZ61376.1 MAG: hypothetical protein DRQ99_20535 [Gammaproteobacteria bacterium]RKZ82403.1 MAG: hypothetical protein DRR16_19740 [Gammaproteobacteria bacterium]
MLDLFQNLRIAEENLHPKFKILRDILKLTGEQEVLKEWTDGFIDRDNKIIKEFQTTFHSSFWEFYLFSFFKEAGFEIDFSKNSPDFIISKPEKILVEAVVSNIKKDGRTENTRNQDDLWSMLIPPYLRKDFYNNLDESIVRHSNAITSKNKKYIDQYSNLKWVNGNEPFVIALSACDQVNYGNEFYYPLMALLYGFYFDVKTEEYIKKDFIIKPNTKKAQIPLNIFLNMEHISAIIFSCTTTLGKLKSLAISQEKSDKITNFVMSIRHDDEFPHYKIQEVTKNTPEYLSDGVFIFHNPYAKNPLSKELFQKTNAVHITIKDNALSFYGKNIPIVSRFNSPKIPEELKRMIQYKTICEFNRMCDDNKWTDAEWIVENLTEDEMLKLLELQIICLENKLCEINFEDLKKMHLDNIRHYTDLNDSHFIIPRHEH